MIHFRTAILLAFALLPFATSAQTYYCSFFVEPCAHLNSCRKDFRCEDGNRVCTPIDSKGNANRASTQSIHSQFGYIKLNVFQIGEKLFQGVLSTRNKGVIAEFSSDVSLSLRPYPSARHTGSRPSKLDYSISGPIVRYRDGVPGIELLDQNPKRKNRLTRFTFPTCSGPFQ